jgi:hypothetical protein
MAGLGIRLFTDEMINTALAPELRRHGYDAESCAEAGRAGLQVPDEPQLEYAADHGRAILTFNMTDFVPLDRAWKAAGREHAGIIVAPEIQDLRHLLRCVQRHLDTYSPAEQHNLLLWLDTSPVPWACQAHREEVLLLPPRLLRLGALAVAGRTRLVS